MVWWLQRFLWEAKYMNSYKYVLRYINHSQTIPYLRYSLAWGNGFAGYTVTFARSENIGKFLLRNLAALTNSTYCNSQHGTLMNRFPVMMTPIAWREFPIIFWSGGKKFHAQVENPWHLEISKTNIKVTNRIVLFGIKGQNTERNAIFSIVIKGTKCTQKMHECSSLLVSRV